MKLKLISFCLLIAGVMHGQYATHLTVAADGSGEYTSIQQALNDTKSYPDKRITIHIKPGVYEEKVEVYAWNSNVTFEGESADNTIITWDDYFDKIDKGRNSTFHTATLRVRGEGFHMKNITVRNTAGPVGQAIALYNEADRSIIEDCVIIGDQDALFVDGNARQYYRNCHIEGTTDFIFGGATAVFDACTVLSKADSYITAASTPAHMEYGLVFLNCRFEALPGVSEVYLGRPWRDFAKTAVINSYLGAHIRPEGWHDWNDPHRQETCTYVEVNNTGPGSTVSNRPDWIHTKDNADLKKWHPSYILRTLNFSDFNID